MPILIEKCTSVPPDNLLLNSAPKAVILDHSYPVGKSTSSKIAVRILEVIELLFQRFLN
jgi:hypothetical protein